MTIKILARKCVPKRDIARQLGMSEGNVRYHLARITSGAVDGRGWQKHLASDFAASIDYWMSEHHGRSLNLADLHHWLVSEHD